MGRISEESGVEKIVKTEEIFEYVHNSTVQFQNIYGVNLQTVLYFVIKMENGMQYS